MRGAARKASTLLSWSSGVPVPPRRWPSLRTHEPVRRPHARTANASRSLKRELLRKDRALAETAALLVLSKKVAAIYNKGEDA